MRVIAGKAKGHQLKGPPGLTTRPTSDKVREALFDMLIAYGDIANVLDLYAGTGALGIEALSRGATHADFVEKNPACCQVIAANLAYTKLREQATIYCQTVQQALSTISATYDLIMIDPPYTAPELDILVEQLGNGQWLAENSLLVVEHSSRRVLRTYYGKLERSKERRHGDTTISIFRLATHDLAASRRLAMKERNNEA